MLIAFNRTTYPRDMTPLLVSGGQKHTIQLVSCLNSSSNLTKDLN